MSVPVPRSSTPPTNAANSRLIRTAMWVAIGALIAAAIVCVIWVLVGSQNGLIGRALLTILLLAAFAGASMLDARLAWRRPAWFALASMVVWVVILLIGAFLIWMPDRGSPFFDGGLTRFVSFVLIVLVLQLALLHIRLFTRTLERNRMPFTSIVAFITMGLVILLAVMLVVPLMLNEWVDFRDIYWRIVVAVTILAAVGTAIVPLINALFSPRRPQAGQLQLPPGWPTYVDGATPLPVLPDGSPDWNAYYTGYPSAGAVAVPAPPSQPAAPQWGQPTPDRPPVSQQQWGGQPQPAQWDGSQSQQQTAQWAGAPAPQPQDQWAAQGQHASQAPDAGQGAQEQPASQPPAVATPSPGYQGYPPPPPLPPQP